MARITLVASCVALFTTTAVAQTTWVVPDGADLAPWIAQAVPGDVLQLNANHPPFNLDKGLVLLGAGSGTVIWPMGWAPTIFDSTMNVPAGQRARIAGLRFTGWSQFSGMYPPVGQRVVVRGAISFEDCRFELSTNVTGALAGAVDVLSGEVVLTRCHLQSRNFHVALRLVDGICTITDSTLLGPSQSVTPQSGWNASGNWALAQSGGVLVGARLLVQGGNNNCWLCYGPGAGGMLLQGGTTFLTDSTVTGGTGTASFPASAPPAIVAHPLVQLARNVLISASPNPPNDPAPGATAVPELVGLSAIGMPQLGQTFTATAFASTAPDLIACFGALDWATATVPLFDEPLWLPLGGATLLGLQAPGAGSTIPFAVAVPNLPGLLGAQLWLQVLQVANNDLHASPVVGGTIR